MTIRSIVCVLVTMLLVGATPALAQFHLDVEEHSLDNGLTILTLENHAAPVCTYYTFFKVGARNERPDNSGMSHFFEHMMFNGAKKYGPKMFDLALESNGGYSNAYTSKDITAYYEDFSSDILELVIDLESDRMGNLALEDEMILSERGVVGEERLVRTDNDNFGMVFEELFAQAFIAHPYGGPVLGWMESIKNFNREDCLEYFHTYYAPNNAVVVIVGDFDTKKTMQLMQEYFGEIPSGPPPPAVLRSEPEQRGARRTVIEKQARYSHLMKGFHIGDKDSGDLYTLEVIQFILTTRESCRIHQAMVNDLELGLGQFGGFSWGFDPSLFYFYIAGAPGKDYTEIDAALDSVLADFVAGGPTEEELARAKNGLTADFYKNYKTNNGMAHQIGRFHTLWGDYNTMYDFVGWVNSVTAEEVKEVAARYFTKKNSTTAILIPEGGA